MKTTGGVDDEHIVFILSGMLHSSLCYINRLVLITHGEYFHALLLSVDLQLFNCSRTIHIAGTEKCFFAPALKLTGKLGCGRCLTSTLKTDHHDNGQLLARTECNLRRLGAHETNHLLINDLDDHLARIQSIHHVLSDGSLLHILDELLYHTEVYIRFQKRHLDFLQRSLDIILCQSSLAAQVLKYILQFFGKTVKCHPTAPLISDSKSSLSAP